MKKPIVVSFKIGGALIAGVVIAIGFLQRDPWVTKRLERMLNDSLSKTIGLPVSMKLSHLDLLSGTMRLSSVVVASATGEWSVSCPSLAIHISWLSALRHRACAVDITLHEPQIVTAYGPKGWTLLEPIQAIATAPVEYPLFLRSCTFDRAAITATTKTMDIRGIYTGSTLFKPQIAATKLSVQQGALLYNKQQICKGAEGAIEVDVPSNDWNAYTLTAHVATDVITRFGPVKSTLFGRYSYDEGSCTWYPIDRSFIVHASNIHLEGDPRAHLKAEGPIQAFAPYATVPSWVQMVTGSCIIEADARLTHDDMVYEGIAALKDPGYAGWHVSVGSVPFKGSMHSAAGTIVLGEEVSKPIVTGSWQYDFDRAQFEISSSLAQKMELFQIKLLERTKGSLTYADGKTAARYSGAVSYPSGSQSSIEGSIASDGKEAHIKGMWGQAPYEFTLLLDPFKIRAGQGLYNRRSNGKKRFELHEQNDTIHAKVDFDFLKEIARSLKLDGGYSVSGQANVATKATFSSGRPRLELALTDGAIKLPLKHNVLQSVAGVVEYDRVRRRITVTDLAIGLYKGTLSSSSAYFDFTAAGALSYAYVPLRCSQLLVSVDKSFTGTFSGYVVAYYRQGRWMCQGSLTLDKAQLRSNLLSSQVQQDLLMQSAPWTNTIDLALQLQTRGPLVVKTPFFQTHAHIKGTLTGTAAKPSVSATIELSDGSFAFPYKPLYITAGKLFLSPQQPNDPLIELTAKNKIKKYTITMHVSGSILQPKISFDSSPHVPEESILTLLVSGSDGPLASAMPNIIMSQVENVLFGSDDKLTRAQQFFKNLLKPLKNVRLVPTLDEEKGIKGSIEVDFNDRLRAKAKNALDLSDETQLEVEYSLSDDMTVKAVRDEKGALGGELEMRWKF
jgi:hypothetical protein